jgi:DMSO/TMAO reductase YedYZ molybdopterin-dependent catalytic subunit
MLKPPIISRRALLKVASGIGTVLLAGCDQLTESETARGVFGSAETLNKAVQRALGRGALAAEFTEADISPVFKANGTTDPDSELYEEISKDGFVNWRLDVGGLVERPAKFSLSDLRALPSRTQITRHDCVEGWSCIGKWTGVRLNTVLSQTGLKSNARYVVFRCADKLPGGGFSAPVPFYESIDLDDAFHEQTILAYDMNGQALDIAHGAPLRLRVERQLGYKHAKYITAIEAVESFAHIGGGNGSYWADLGYSWYAGI